MLGAFLVHSCVVLWVWFLSAVCFNLQQTNINGAVEMMNRIGSVEFDANGRSREDEYESRSGSDNVEAGSGDDLFAENPPGVKRKRYHRHTPQQIQELEA